MFRWLAAVDLPCSALRGMTSPRSRAAVRAAALQLRKPAVALMPVCTFTCMHAQCIILPVPHPPTTAACARPAEFRKWCPSLRVVRLHTSDPQEKARLRKQVLADPSQFDVAVTTYEMINSKVGAVGAAVLLGWLYCAWLGG